MSGSVAHRLSGFEERNEIVPSSPGVMVTGDPDEAFRGGIGRLAQCLGARDSLVSLNFSQFRSVVEMLSAARLSLGNPVSRKEASLPSRPPSEK